MTAPTSQTEESNRPPLQLESRDPESSADPRFDDNDGYSGVYKILKTVDYWFERELHQIEQESHRWALTWAEENMPGLTEQHEEQLPPEKVLASACASLWKRWPERTKVKMQDAIDGAAGELGQCVASARAAVTEAKIASEMLADAERKIEDIRSQTEREVLPVKYDRYIPIGVAAAITVLMTLVEFVANQPVFRIIWPLSTQIAQKVKDNLELNVSDGIFAGISLTTFEMLNYVEASVLAFVVVLVLLIAGEMLGVSARVLSSLKPQDYPFSSTSINSLHRQYRLVAGAAAVAIAASLIFLFSARQNATNTAAERVRDAEVLVQGAIQHRDSLEAETDDNGADLQLAIEDVRTAQADLREKKVQREFAKTVRDNNLPIFLLNMALVAAAAIVGFLTDRRDLTEQRGEHPDLKPLKSKCMAARERVLRQTAEAREQVRLGESALARVHSLMRSDPLATIEAKRSKLEGIIPLWRGENARLRGVDPKHIAAFQTQIVLPLEDISGTVVMREPETLGSAKQELTVLRNESHRIERKADMTLSAAA